MTKRKLFATMFAMLLAALFLADETLAKDRRIALLNLTVRNGQDNSETNALKRALDVAGIPYRLTSDVNNACSYAMIVTSSDLSDVTLDAKEILKLVNYVANGGVLVSSNVSSTQLYPVFGISQTSRSINHYTLRWQVASQDNSLHYFDDPNEIVISFSRMTTSIPTTSYSLDGGIPLALYDDAEIAVTKNIYGKGKAYATGFSYEEIILRNQLGRDYSARREVVNGFEPTTDTIMLFLRAIYESNVKFATWKHTIPRGSRSSLIITHDVDTYRSMAFMHKFAQYENTLSIHAMYFVCTHYVNDGVNTDYYTPNIKQAQQLVEYGHRIGSHSVDHSPDFARETIVPMGAPGNTKENYYPRYTHGITRGATVFGELEVSKNLLQADLGVPVTAFRSGQLLYNDKQANVLKIMGYRYDSSRGANPILTHFPFRLKIDNRFDAPDSDIYEIPVSISDKHMDENNWNQYPQVWLDVIERNAANFAPSVLLIHPSSEFKLNAEKELLDKLPKEIEITPFLSFGDYWRARDQLDYGTKLIESTNTLYVNLTSANSFPIDPRLSLFIKDGAKLSSVHVHKPDKSELPYLSLKFGENDLIIYQLGSGE
jgi:peptidoglycan/xylan/chitin deacetylase (PgdA/CDA1 family)